MLLYKDGNLMQVLEGEESAVRALYAKITADDRHRGHMILWDGCELDAAVLRLVDGFSRPG